MTSKVDPNETNPEEGTVSVTVDTSTPEPTDDWGRTEAQALTDWHCPGEESEHWAKHAALEEGEWMVECGHCGTEEVAEEPEHFDPIPDPREDASSAPGTLTPERTLCVAAGTLDDVQKMLVSFAGAGVPTLLLQDPSAGRDSQARFHIAVPTDLALSPVVFFVTLRQDVDRACVGQHTHKHRPGSGEPLSPEEAEAMQAEEHPER